MQKQLHVSIEGMHCNSCEMLITEELQDLKGTSDISVSFKDRSATLSIDPELVNVDDVFAAIARAGKYTATVKSNGETLIKERKIAVSSDTVVRNGNPVKITIETTADAFPTSEFIKLFERERTDAPVKTMTTASLPQKDVESTTTLLSNKRAKLDISGMHCASCAGLIERSLKKVPGVTQANVNFAAEKALIVFDEHSAKTEDLVTAVTKTGYGATIVKEGSSVDETAKRTKEINHVFHLFIRSLMLSVPMLYFMFFDFFSWFPGSSLLPYVGVISLILATPVQFWMGWGFYKGAWSSLKMKTFNMDSLIAIGTSTAYFYSLFNFINYYLINKSFIGLNGQKIPELYFETAAFLITFVMLGKWLEKRAKGQTGEAIKKLMGLQAKTARVIRDGQTLDIPIDQVVNGDTILVRPGENSGRWRSCQRILCR